MKLIEDTNSVNWVYDNRKEILECFVVGRGVENKRLKILNTINIFKDVSSEISDSELNELSDMERKLLEQAFSIHFNPEFYG